MPAFALRGVIDHAGTESTEDAKKSGRPQQHRLPGALAQEITCRCCRRQQRERAEDHNFPAQPRVTQPQKNPPCLKRLTEVQKLACQPRQGSYYGAWSQRVLSRA